MESPVLASLFDTELIFLHLFIKPCMLASKYIHLELLCPYATSKHLRSSEQLILTVPRLWLVGKVDIFAVVAPKQ